MPGPGLSDPGLPGVAGGLPVGVSGGAGGGAGGGLGQRLGSTGDIRSSQSIRTTLVFFFIISFLFYIEG